VNLVVNGEPEAVDDGLTVAQLVASLGCGTKGVAVAVNEAVVPRSIWPVHRLESGDRVEILNAAQGG
jgi:sulfur carrier protein